MLLAAGRIAIRVPRTAMRIRAQRKPKALERNSGIVRV